MNAPPTCTLRLGDARELDWIADDSVHLVLTSPPYWTLKKYNDHPQQLGDVAEYERRECSASAPTVVGRSARRSSMARRLTSAMA